MTHKLLIIYTGGTIGMVQTEQGLAPSAGLRARIIETLGESSLHTLPKFDVIELCPLIDSSNIKPDNWSQIYDTLQSHWESYAGFVVLHGTDTLAYTASALSFMLATCNKNVIITGSQIPLGMSQSDAVSNLEAAITLAVEPSFGSTTVLFHRTLMQGNRITKFSSHDFSAFQSFNMEPLAELSTHKQYSAQYTPYEGIHAPAPRTYDFIDESVAVLTLHPSLPSYAYESFLLNDKCRAVILQTYGAGNIADQNSTLVKFLEAMQAKQKTVINVTQCAHGGTAQGAYAASSLLNKLAILDGKDITLEAAFTKIHWLLAQSYSYEQIQKIWPTAINGEFT